MHMAISELVCHGQFGILGGKLHLAAKLVQKEKTIPIVILWACPIAEGAN
jgi:hypothetical protein